MMEPKVLLFDEPTSALDPTMVGEVLAMIRMLAKQNMTMLIVTHEMNFAREVANRVLFFADKGIYEQGTPAEIFDAPKREKTVAFIRKLKYFVYEINSRHFDLLSMQGGIHSFTEKYGINRKLSYRLALCSEELCYEMLAGCHDENSNDINISLEISYSEADCSTVLNLTSGGKKFNPFEDLQKISDDDDNVHLGVTILKKVAKGGIYYDFSDGLNKIQIKL